MLSQEQYEAALFCVDSDASKTRLFRKLLMGMGSTNNVKFEKSPLERKLFLAWDPSTSQKLVRRFGGGEKQSMLEF